ncbi:demethoxyubiquinone hydroxylase family protein [Parvularcula lutaonensis]|uniref:3-demethoxyubiquinol 3-hydroxylase n=1 Tax=Parvularcula lutaonensis TaxID=491923 RepID=A0ABV7MC24_9PROT|nr:demethoxyubiquinone hydroxylase family protein [Parvularcula lutaonensis]GGY40167.1 2-nonaprenyl-3-methyl-6-methoxy-1,4-benzoquinol hydroxylase [Parvularcula lutaonensis]
MSETARPPVPTQLKRRTEEMLRVDHAGEYGAVQIYRGQRAVFGDLPGKTRIALLLKDMEEGEQKHLETFDRLLAERGARPTLLAPLWNAAGFALGAGTALMGEKAAMACTSAVESVIEKHYQEQVDELDGQGEDELRATFAEFREDELEHHDTAIEEGAEQAPGYRFMKRIIEAGCNLAIKVSEKV